MRPSKYTRKPTISLSCATPQNVKRAVQMQLKLLKCKINKRRIINLQNNLQMQRNRQNSCKLSKIKTRLLPQTMLSKRRKSTNLIMSSSKHASKCKMFKKSNHQRQANFKKKIRSSKTIFSLCSASSMKQKQSKRKSLNISFTNLQLKKRTP